MEPAVAVLVEIERQHELRKELRLDRPRCRIHIPADPGVLSHPAGQRSLAVAEGQALCVSHTAELKAKLARKERTERQT